ncbi:MAG: hypothetical protein ABL888_19460 [Pirellulaceae bacterium]
MLNYFNRLFAGLLTIVLTSTATFAFQDVDLEELVLRIKSESTTRAKLFVGLSAKSQQTVSNSEKIESKNDFNFNLSKPHQWRSDLIAKLPDGQLHQTVTARNGELCFSASKKSTDEFEVELIGRDHDTQSKFEFNLLNQFPFVVVPQTVLSLSLEDFLSTPHLKATWILDLVDHRTRPVEGINFRIHNQSGVVFGELHWLPNDGFLLQRILVKFEIPKSDGQVSIQTAADNTINYNLVDGELLPWTIISKNDNGRTITHEISSIGNANVDQSFYTPESIARTVSRPLILK